MKLCYSLRYRIAGTIFALEAVMMAVVLWQTLSLALEGARTQQLAHEEATLNAASEVSRNALISEEYGELLPYIAAVPQIGGVMHVLVANHNNTVIASTQLSELGKPKPPLFDNEREYWRTREIKNDNELLGLLAVKFSNEKLLAATAQARNLGISVALTGMIVIAVVGLLMGYLLTRRLDVLQKTAQRFANGDLEAKVNLGGEDELSEVGKAFDHMADKVQHTLDDLEYQVAKRTAELAVARDEALEASRIKSMFLANMSHELRTPLNAIIGYSEILAEESKTQANLEHLEDSEKIRSAGLHLLGLINSILDLNKVESGKMEVYYEYIDVYELVESVVTAANPLVVKNHNTLEVNYENSIGLLYGDNIKIQQILLNVVGNAAKFTERGQIIVSISRQGESVAFKVQDSGIGMSEEHLDKLFVEFSQADPSITKKYGGTGLGLALSKHFCELMNSEISVSSELGTGSVFTITINEQIDAEECVQQAQNA